MDAAAAPAAPAAWRDADAILHSSAAHAAFTAGWIDLPTLSTPLLRVGAARTVPLIITRAPLFPGETLCAPLPPGVAAAARRGAPQLVAVAAHGAARAAAACGEPFLVTLAILAAVAPRGDAGALIARQRARATLDAPRGVAAADGARARAVALDCGVADADGAAGARPARVALAGGAHAPAAAWARADAGAARTAALAAWRAAALPRAGAARAAALPPAAAAFWLARHAPLDAAARAEIARAPTAAAMLRATARALRAAGDGGLRCVECGTAVLRAGAGGAAWAHPFDGAYGGGGGSRWGHHFGGAFFDSEGSGAADGGGRDGGGGDGSRAGGAPLTSLFSNPVGDCFRLLLLARLDAARVLGLPSLAASWFPGFAWTALVCAGADCGAHIGWRFDFTGPLTAQALRATVLGILARGGPRALATLRAHDEGDDDAAWRAAAEPARPAGAPRVFFGVRDDAVVR